MARLETEALSRETAVLRVTAERFSCPLAAWESLRSPPAGLLAASKHDRPDQPADKQVCAVLQGLLQQPVQGLLLQPNSAQAGHDKFSATAVSQPSAPKSSSSCWCSKSSTGSRITGWSQSRDTQMMGTGCVSYSR